MDSIHPWPHRKNISWQKDWKLLHFIDTTTLNISRRHGRNDAKKSTYVFNVEHETLGRNHIPDSDLERGWVIDSAASVHMTPFIWDCKNIHVANRNIFLADGSAVLCKEMGTIEIPVLNGQIKLGILRLDKVLIIPSLDRGLFLVNSFFTKRKWSGSLWEFFHIFRNQGWS